MSICFPKKGSCREKIRQLLLWVMSPDDGCLMEQSLHPTRERTLTFGSRGWPLVSPGVSPDPQLHPVSDA